MKFNKQFAAGAVVCAISMAGTTGVFADSLNLAGGSLFTDWQSGVDNGVIHSAISHDRIDFGFNSGAYLEAHSPVDSTRPGEFLFVYGGAPDLGKVVFSFFDGTNWNEKMVLDSNGNLGIGLGADKVPCADCKLAVKGKIMTQEVVVATTGWPDYVFRNDYQLMPLSEVSSFIDSNGRLPGVPSAEQVSTDGLNVSSMTKVMMEKIEELTLHMIRLDNENKKLKNEIVFLKTSLVAE